MEQKKWTIINFISIVLVIFSSSMLTIERRAQIFANKSMSTIVILTLVLFCIHGSYLLFSYSVLKRENYNFKILAFIISIGLSFSLLQEKTVLGKEVNKSIYLLADILAFFFVSIIFFGFAKIDYKSIKNQIKNLKKFFLEHLFDVIVVSVPYFLFSCHGLASKYAFLPIGIYAIIKYRKNMTKLDKKTILISGIFIFLLIASYFFNREIAIFKETERVIISFLILLSLILIKLNKNLYHKIYFVSIVAMLEPSVTIINRFLMSRFNVSFRYAATDYPGSACIFSIVLLIFILFYNKYYLNTLFAIIILSTVLEGSRGAIVAIMISSLIVLMIRFKNNLKKLILIVSGMAIIVVVIINFTFAKNTFFGKNLDMGVEARNIIWTESILQIKKKPFTGNGMRTLGTIAKLEGREKLTMKDASETLSSRSESHNNILESARSMGIFGLLMYIIFNLFILIECFFAFKKDKKVIYLLPIFAMLGIEIIGMTNGTTLNGGRTNLLFYLILALTFRLIDSNYYSKL